ncbi:MAG: metal-dependent hydrolase [Chryseolinea sp.]
MDTLTHFAIGACVGEIIGGKSIGKRALFVGGLLQLIPDIDVLFSVTLDPASNVLAHRGFTHSFLFVSLITPLLAWSFTRWSRGSPQPFYFWLRFIGVQILLHVILDSCNAYGTGWFEPFSHHRVSFHTLFVADPFFSIPVGLSCLALFLMTLKNNRRVAIAVCGLLLSGCYLGYSLTNKFLVDRAVQRALVRQSIPYSKYITTPTPFNNLLWFVATTGTSGSYVGYRSVFDREADISFEFFPRNDSLLPLAADKEEVAKLVRFSQEFYTLNWKADTLVFNDLRFGQMLGWQNSRAEFAFHYYLSPRLDNKLVIQRGRFANWDRAGLNALLTRIGGEK